LIHLDNLGGARAGKSRPLEGSQSKDMDMHASNLGGRLKVAAVIALAGASLAACATKGYVREQVAALSSRVDAGEAKTQAGLQQEDAAAQSAANAAQSATSAAENASASARNANQGVDQLSARMDGLEQQVVARKAHH
jgi:hypothetical protein